MSIIIFRTLNISLSPVPAPMVSDRMHYFQLRYTN